ncbi:aminopeptidase [Lysinibacillus sp. NPDC092081]|uniref:aminopeptidase n=1 Tax=Lysinibacillus sp. NPDC092081 TaxID=3364131 RepID=UPI00382C7BD5
MPRYNCDRIRLYACTKNYFHQLKAESCRFAFTTKNVEDEQGQEILKSLISTDKVHILKIALVPHTNHPFHGLIYYIFNRLFDENVSNHLAMGIDYNLNQSLPHDFIITLGK